MQLRSKTRKNRRINSPIINLHRRYYRQVLQRILSVVKVLGTPLVMENIFSRFSSVEIVLLFHGLVDQGNLVGVKAIQNSVGGLFWQRKLQKMAKTHPILRFLKPPEKIGFVQFCELMDRHDHIQLRKSSKLTIDLHHLSYNWVLLSTKYVCLVHSQSSYSVKPGSKF